MRRQVRFFIKWFDIVASAMKAKPGTKLSMGDMKRYFAQSGCELEEGVAYDQKNTEHVNHIDRCLEHVLPRFQRLGLVAIYYDRNRYTPRLGLHVPENVAELTRRGERLLRQPRSWQACYWAASVLAEKVTETALKYKWVFTVAVMALSIGKLILQWDLMTAGVAAVLAGFVTFIVNALH